MDDNKQNNDKENLSPESKGRWSNYGNYRQIIWVWMMNEITVMFSPAEISHNGFYVHAVMQTIAVIFIGIPLVYSEICVAQYSNCNIFSMWNFFPLFRYVGFGTFYLIVLKTIYLLVLTSWYLEYTFYASLDPPPWFSCEEYNSTKCMVKRINVSIFQHCLEAQLMFNDDCGMKTASHFFFEREIGSHNTKNEDPVFIPWKEITASTTISCILFGLSIRKEKFMQIVIKILIVYVFFVILILFCAALSTSGSWYATSIAGDWSYITYSSYFNSIRRGFLTLGSGCGIIVFLSRDVPFRSPATMTSICTSLFSLCICIMYALIVFGGIKTVSFFHGEEENVIEIGANLFFIEFASVSEILSYFDGITFWSFAWFSSICFCLLSNLWILHYFLRDIILQVGFARKYKKISCGLLIFAINLLSWPFLYSDLAGSLTDATELIQTSNCFLFSISLYWFYGFRNHNNDITFMIGVKASYFWKIAWLFNPVFIFVIIIIKWKHLEIIEYEESYYIEGLSMSVDLLLFYFLVGIYCLIVVLGIIAQIVIYYRKGHIRDILSPSYFWGPRDEILFKSRTMFVPEIMTTEFLYRQVRIHGYYSNKKVTTQQVQKTTSESSQKQAQWSPLTSN